MQNISKSVNQPVKLSKRLISGLVDLLIVALFSYILFNYVATPIANETHNYTELSEIYDDKIEQYYDIAVEYDLGTYKNDKFVEKEGLDKDDEEYIAFEADPRVVVLQKEMNKLHPKLNLIANMMLLISTLISEVVFWLIIPLFEKDNRSIGMKFNKLYLIHRDEKKVSKKQIVYRFLSLYLIQTAVFYLMFDLSFIYMSPLICLIVMYSSMYRNSIHDLIAKTRVVENEPILFASVEERNNYVFNKLKVKKDIIDAEVNDVIEDEITLLERKEESGE